ncbi:MAG: hypothetical protein QXX51_09055 [Candidatus Bathyarchaeia archaeon]
MKRLVRFSTLEKIFVIIFTTIIVAALCLSLILRMQSIAIVLLLVDFIVAGIIAVFGSLRIRDEEEEKLFK